MFMTGLQVLLVAGTHGNEINAPWLINQWSKYPDVINDHGLRLSKVIANPEALKLNKRYLQYDLNRSFRSDFLNSKNSNTYEFLRARELFLTYGPHGLNPCQVALDFHSTTAAMGTSLVVYGRRPLDLALSSLLQARLGLPIYLHEGDNNQKGFLVEAWPCGLVIEIGPVPQGTLNANIINQTRLTLQVCLEELENLNSNKAFFPDQIVVHRHLKSIDYPRSDSGEIEGYVHFKLQNSNWSLVNNGDPLFMKLNGETVIYKGEPVVPVFINEAAYMEKNIAMSFTKREVWKFSSDWKLAVNDFFSKFT